jgi:cyclophilin family peptidyl-prolyl cis-trans isomerase
MNIRSLITLIFLSGLTLTGCATNSRYAGIAPGSVVMLVKVKKERKPQRIIIALDEQAAPQTVANFKELLHRHYYDGLRFHRLFPHQMVQTGDPKSRLGFIPGTLQKIGLDLGDADRTGTGGPGYTIPAEIRLKADKGAVATARLPDPINPTRASNGSQFFVCISAMPQLNGQYTVFGHVTEGLEVLDAISGIPVNSNDFPTENIVIESIRVVE